MTATVEDTAVELRLLILRALPCRLVLPVPIAAPWQTKGMRVPHQVLAEDDIEKIQREWEAGDPQRVLAARYGISQPQPCRRLKTARAS